LPAPSGFSPKDPSRLGRLAASRRSSRHRRVRHLHAPRESSAPRGGSEAPLSRAAPPLGGGPRRRYSAATTPSSAARRAPPPQRLAR